MTTWLVDREWRTQLAEGFRLHNASLRVVCPFIKQRPIAELLGTTRPQPLEVITRFNLDDFGRGVSDVAALRAILRAGGRVRGVQDLHAKVFLFGDARAVVTSANLTNRGLGGNHEFGCVSEEITFLNACRAYFDRLWDASAGSELSILQLDEWDAQVAAFLASGGRPELKPGLPDHGIAVNVDPMTTPATSGWPAESGRAFVKFFGEGHSRLPWTFETFDEVGRAGCHWACTYPRGKRPRQVEDGDTLFTARLVRDPPDTLVFGRAIGIAHVEGRDDATAAEIEARPWRAKWPHYIRVHHAEFVAGPLGNGIRLNELMDALGPDAFASTQRNQQRGLGNVNPRAALRQQAAVQLSGEGAAWLTERLENTFEIHGRVPADKLATLDWPS